MVRTGLVGKNSIPTYYIAPTAEPAFLLVVPRQLKNTSPPLHNCFTVSSLTESRSGAEKRRLNQDGPKISHNQLIWYMYSDFYALTYALCPLHPVWVCIPALDAHKVLWRHMIQNSRRGKKTRAHWTSTSSLHMVDQCPLSPYIFSTC